MLDCSPPRFLVDDVHQAFAKVKEIEETEGRTFVHPFEGFNTVLGTATLGLELCEQAGPIDAVVVPIGGGGLCAGVASAVKQLQPMCTVYGAISASHRFSAASRRVVKLASCCLKKAASPARSSENLSAISLAIRLPFSGSIQ